MDNQDEIPVFPVAGWAIGPLPAFGAITIRLDFLSNQLQDTSAPNIGRHYGLLPDQARELVAAINSALEKVENAPQQAPQGPRH